MQPTVGRYSVGDGESQQSRDRSSLLAETTIGCTASVVDKAQHCYCCTAAVGGYGDDHVIRMSEKTLPRQRVVTDATVCKSALGSLILSL